MKLLEKALPGDHNLFLFGDDHEGAVLRHNEGWEQLVDMMNSKYADCDCNFGVDHGDIIEAIPASDPRWYEQEESYKYLTQITNAVKNRKHIADKLVAILDGNHPFKYWKFGNATQEICSQLGVPYGTFSAHITYKYKNGNVIYRHYCTHGRKSIGSTADDPIRQDANMKLQLKRHLKNKFSDCVVSSKGHSHKLIIAEPKKALFIHADSKIKQSYTQARQADTYIPEDLRWYVNTGSFLKLYADGWSGYAERSEYDPMELGFAVMRVRGGLIQGIDKVVLESYRKKLAEVTSLEVAG